MSNGSLVDYESQKIERTVLSTTVAELYSFMKCFGLCQFSHGLWMDMSGEVVEISMRTDAKNLVTTARTIHLLEQKETIHMNSILRQESCSGSIHNLAHISNQNCLAECLTQSSAKGDRLITAVKTEWLLEVDVHPNLRTLMEQKDFLSAWCRTFMHKGEKCFILNAWRISLSPASREGPFHVMFLRTSMDYGSQDATKITSALAGPRIYSSVKMMTLDMHMNAVIKFSVCHFVFHPVFWQCRHEDTLVSAWQAIRTRNQFMKITIALSLETLIAGKKVTSVLTWKVKVKKMHGLAQKTDGVLWISSYQYSIGRVSLGFMEELDPASISANFAVAVLISLVEREAATKHVLWGRRERLWLDEWCYLSRC